MGQKKEKEKKPPVISGEGEGRPRDNYSGASAMGSLIITEAMETYQKFCEVFGHEEGDEPLELVRASLPNEPLELELAPRDKEIWARFYAWMKKYVREHPNRWWNSSLSKKLGACCWTFL